MKFIRKIWNAIITKRNKQWQDIEYFNPDWKERIQNMAQFIEPNEHVMDMGCGQGWLKEYLAPGCKYSGVDYAPRDSKTIVCDFNAYQFPEIDADVAFVSGCLEYITDYEWFIGKIADKFDKCIISYCTIENFPDLSERIEKCWVNHLSRQEIVDIFEKHNLHLIRQLDTLNVIFVFSKKAL